mmetsp:Transcript_56419/g.83864  ORF Transcript_56419/g.83864 Transcript_56419/m.83864 type:complete len:81 (-) Transcript_56419:211-453(-)
MALIKRFSDNIGMSFGLDKCAILTIVNVKPSGGMDKDTSKQSMPPMVQASYASDEVYDTDTPNAKVLSEVLEKKKERNIR